MARSRMLLAALGGLAVSFVVFMALTMLTPDAELERGEGETPWQRFQFVHEGQTYTAGSVARIVNEDAVPLELVVRSPGGVEEHRVVPGGGIFNLSLDERGTYVVGSGIYSWGETSIEVRSANPFVRFFEDLRDFELRSRRG